MKILIVDDDQDLLALVGFAVCEVIRTLLARVKALLRRAGIEASGAMSAGALALDLESGAGYRLFG